MNRFIFTLFFTGAAFLASGQSKDFTSKEKLDSFCDSVMMILASEKFSEGIQLFRRNSVMDTVTVNNIGSTLQEQMVGILPAYGKIREFELIGIRTITNTLARRRYLLKFETYFLTFDFILYNNGTGWTVSNFYYRDEPLTLFN